MFYHYLFREEGNIMDVKQMESRQTKASQTIQLHCLENRVASGYVTFGSYWGKGTLVIHNFKKDQTDSFTLQNEKKESNKLMAFKTTHTSGLPCTIYKYICMYV